MHLCLLGPDGNVRSQQELPGINALTVAEDYLRGLFSSLDLPRLRAIRFYGAGVVSAPVAEKIRRALPAAPEVEVESDLLGAARSLLGHGRGVACILGTGSNTGLYDGSRIVSQVPPLGFILGDEGSGANLGRLLVRDLYRNRLDPGLRELFERETGLTYADVLDAVYRRPQANRFLASLVPFIRRHCNTHDFPRLEAMVSNAFEGFFSEMAGTYGETRIAITGGLAAAFADEIHRACPREMEITRITDRPMSGLITYHQPQ